MISYADDEPLTVEEVAAWLRISRSQVYDMIRDGTLATISIRTSRRVMARVVKDYLASLTGVA